MIFSRCDFHFLGLCLTRPPVDPGISIFGFPGFLAALALLVLVYTQSDPLYKFRISIAPLPLYHITFISTIIIGLGTLLTDLWFVERWPSLPWGFSRGFLQAGFGLHFLIVLSLWTYFAFIRPPVFGKLNSRRYAVSLFRTVLKGSETELQAIAAELARSSTNLIKYTQPIEVGNNRNQETTAQLPKVSGYAHDILLLIGNRKFCRYIMKSSPITAIAIFEDAAEAEKWRLPLSQFAKNVTTEALRDNDSIIYHEDDSYSSGLLGYLKPFSKALYGNYRLVEGLANVGESPLDSNYYTDSIQFEAYCRIVRITFENYISSGSFGQHSYALNRALDNIQRAPFDIYKLNGTLGDYYPNDALERLGISVNFTKEIIKILGEAPNLNFGRLRLPLKNPFHFKTLFDNIAELMFELILEASSVKEPTDLAWTVQHNTVWGGFFSFSEDTKAWRVIRFKLFRLLFDEIKRLEEFPNYKSARVLGICLNVMGLNIGNKKGFGEGEYPLRKAVLNWTKQNYQKLVQVHPPVAKACLMGGISYDDEKKQLVKTYAQGLNLEPNKGYLDLI